MGAVNDFLIFLEEGFTGLFNAAGDQDLEQLFFVRLLII